MFSLPTFLAYIPNPFPSQQQFPDPFQVGRSRDASSKSSRRGGLLFKTSIIVDARRRCVIQIGMGLEVGANASEIMGQIFNMMCIRGGLDAVMTIRREGPSVSGGCGIVWPIQIPIHGLDISVDDDGRWNTVRIVLGWSLGEDGAIQEQHLPIGDIELFKSRGRGLKTLHRKHSDSLSVDMCMDGWVSRPLEGVEIGLQALSLFDLTISEVNVVTRGCLGEVMLLERL